MNPETSVAGALPRRASNAVLPVQASGSGTVTIPSGNALKGSQAGSTLKPSRSVTTTVSSARTLRAAITRARTMRAETSGPTGVPDHIEAQLLAGKSAKRRLRVRVSGTMLVAGFACGVLSQLAYLVDGIADWQWPSGIAWTAVVVSMIIIGLAPLQDDRHLTQCVLVANCFTVAFDLYWSGGSTLANWKKWQANNCHSAGRPMRNDGNLYCITTFLAGASFVFIDASFIFASLGVLLHSIYKPCVSTTKLQQRMWRLHALFLLAMFWVDVAYAVHVVWMFHSVEGSLLFCIADVLCYLVARSPTLQQCVHTLLIRRYDARDALASAAGIASLVGNTSATTVLAESSSRFRAVSIEQLSIDDLRTSPIRESGTLYEKAFPIRLGKCDAFISHSWHDDADAKWEALQEWCDKFKDRNQRDAFLWIDKACIDQRCIQADLRCLPVFLSGCKELVIFCGPSYLSRLWCIMEIFCFAHMGGSIDNIKLVPVLRKGCEVEDEQAIRESFEYFDAYNAKCFNPAEKARMLEIITAAFGCMDGFNEAVRSIINEAKFKVSDKQMQCGNSSRRRRVLFTCDSILSV